MFTKTIFGLNTTALKVILVGLIVTTVAFLVATIVLAVENHKLEDELDYYKNKFPIETTTQIAPNITTTTVAPPKISYRLPGNIVPISYDLLYVGKISNVQIHFTVIEDTNSIVVHSRGLSIGSIQIETENGDKLNLSDWNTMSPQQFFVIEVREVLEAEQTYRLTLGYDVNMTGKKVGLYQSFYEGANGENNSITITNFEPVYARQAFPCLDEPTMKAKFTLSVFHSNSTSVVSNMKVENVTAFGDGLLTTFTQTPFLSAQHLAWVVSSFSSKSKEVMLLPFGPKVMLSVYADGYDLDKVNFALNFGSEALQFLVNYFLEYKYPLEKLDLVAVPEYPVESSGGLGLILFPDSSLLFDEENDTVEKKQFVALNIARELVGIWFGSLVTQTWWDDIWFYKGITRHLAYVVVDAIYPEWEVMDHFLVSDLFRAFDIDSSQDSHPLKMPVETPEEIIANCDELTFLKGGAIIRMLEYILRSEGFSYACRVFLASFKFSNAPASKFIEKMSDTYNPGDYIRNSVQSFTTYSGIPIITAKKSKDPNDFYHEFEELSVWDEEEKKYYRWLLPATYFYDWGSNSVVPAWFLEYPMTFIFPMWNTTKWLKLNKLHRGYYHVKYDHDMISDFTNYLLSTFGNLAPADRASILYDTFVSVEDSTLSYTVMMELLQYLRLENDALPWQVASSVLLHIKTLLRNTTYSDKFLAFGQNCVENMFQQVSWTQNNSHSQNLLRMIVLQTACALGHETCLNEAKQIFDDWMSNTIEQLDANVRQIVYSFGVASMETESDWNRVWQVYLATVHRVEKQRLLIALAQTKLSTSLQRLIDLAWDTDYVRQQDYLTCLNAIAENPIGTPLVLAHFSDNWTKLADRFDAKKDELYNSLMHLASQLSERTQLMLMEIFFYVNNNLPQSLKYKTLSRIEKNIDWIAKNEQIIGSWLDSNNNSTKI